jgi:pilus assembly protein CpaF
VELLNLENYKAEIHRTLISKLDLEKLSRVNSTQARQAVSGIVKEIIADQRVPLNFDEQEKIQADLLDEVFGLGPLEPLLRDPKISDIMVNDKDHVFIEKGGLLQRVSTTFRDDRHLLQIIDRIVSTPVCPTARASTPSFRRWLSTARRCPFAVSAPARWPPIRWSS